MMKIVVVAGSPRKNGLTQVMMKHVFDYAKIKNPDTELINLSDGNIECYRGYDEEYNDETKKATVTLIDADIWLIGSPIYNSFFSSALKNLFEYVNYKKTEGKVAGMAILASGNIGFTNVQTLLTQLLSYFRVITNPKAAFLTTEAISNEGTINDDAKIRLEKMVDDTIELSHKIKKS